MDLLIADFLKLFLYFIISAWVFSSSLAVTFCIQQKVSVPDKVRGGVPLQVSVYDVVYALVIRQSQVSGLSRK